MTKTINVPNINTLVQNMKEDFALPSTVPAEHDNIIRLSEAVPMRPFFRAKNGGLWRTHHTEGDICTVNTYFVSLI